MLGLFFILASASAKCEHLCFRNCLAGADLVACSKSCCSFENILFEEDKIFYLSQGEKLEIELDPVFIEIPSVPVEIKPHPAEAILPASKQRDPVTCEEKCLNHCKKTGPKCVEVCKTQHCSAPQQPEPSNTWTKLLVSVTVFILIFFCLKPKQEEAGYVRLA